MFFLISFALQGGLGLAWPSLEGLPATTMAWEEMTVREWDFKELDSPETELGVPFEPYLGGGRKLEVSSELLK